MMSMNVAETDQSLPPQAADTAVVVAESASSGPTWMLIIVMGLAVMLAARPRKDSSSHLGR
ncbi:MAG: hypothetical protein AAGI89_14625 [Pseudomonadota bacterium]